MRVDLRTDTSTLPTKQMRRAMYEAEVGNDRYGEDPTTNQLEALAAQLCGMEAAVFLPTGTMANGIAGRLFLRNFEAVVCETTAVVHVAGHFETAFPRFKLVAGDEGIMSASSVRAAIDDVGYAGAKARLLVVENTAMEAGGTPLGADESRALCEVARDAGVASYLDGARVFHAAVELEVPVAELTSPFDMAMICVSKGLCAPAGALLVGTSSMIHEARRLRAASGGQMRQTGLLAAAGIVALQHMIPRLAEDHQRARHLADRLANLPGVRLAHGVRTNIIFLEVTGAGSVPELARRLEERGVLSLAFSRNRLRLVVHHDISDAASEYAITAFEAELAKQTRTPSHHVI